MIDKYYPYQQRYKILGGPGCGKTTKILNILSDYITMNQGGIYTSEFDLTIGETYTFSFWWKPDCKGVQGPVGDGWAAPIQCEVSYFNDFSSEGLTATHPLLDLNPLKYPLSLINNTLGNHEILFWDCLYIYIYIYIYKKL